MMKKWLVLIFVLIPVVYVTVVCLKNNKREKRCEESILRYFVSLLFRGPTLIHQHKNFENEYGEKNESFKRRERYTLRNL